MTILKYNLFLILLLNINFAFTQNNFSISIDLSESNDSSVEVVEHDNYYYTSTLSSCFSISPLNSCFYIIKLDSEGQEIWRKKFEDLEIGLYHPSRFVINVLPNNTLLITAGVRVSGGIRHPYLVNLSLDGEVLWTKTFDNTMHTVLWQSKLLPSGNLLNFGWEENSIGSHLVIRKIDMSGEVLMKKDIFTDCPADLPNNMSWTSDGHLLIGHYCDYEFSQFDEKYVMATKIDTFGNEIWTEYYDDMPNLATDIIKGMVLPLPDEGYSFIWPKPLGGAWYETTLFSYDSLRQSTWQLHLPEVLFESRMAVHYVNNTANGDLVWAGTLLGGTGSEFVPCIGRVSPEGELKWIRYYRQTDRPWDIVPRFSYITETSDGGFIASGFRRDQIENNPDQTDLNPWILKVGPDGCMTPGCTDETIYLQNDTAFVNTKDVLFNQPSYFQLSPNPADSKTQLNFLTTAANNNQTIKIFSIDGRLMQQIALEGSEQTIDINLVDFSAGIYVVTLEEEGQVLQRERLVKR